LVLGILARCRSLLLGILLRLRLQERVHATEPAGLAEAVQARLVQVQLIRHALGQRPALDQSILRLQEFRIPATETAIARLHATHLHHLGAVLLQLHQHAGAVDRRGQQCEEQRERHHACKDAQHHPATLDQDVPVGQQVDLVVAQLFLDVQRERGGGGTHGRDLARRLAVIARWQAVACPPERPRGNVLRSSRKLRPWWIRGR
jgi:hypothetical protein